jgi:hypothetical protein
VVAARFSPSGRRLDVNDLPVSRGALGSSPAVVFDGDRFVVAWIGDDDIYLSYVNPFGSVEDPVVAIPGRSLQYVGQIGLAASDSGVLVTWSEYGRFGSAVRSVRVDRQGVVLDPTPILIADPARSISIASDGRDYLVVWAESTIDSSSVRATRLTADGTVLDPGGFLIGTGISTPETAVAWNGQRYLVVWSDNPAGDQLDLFGARVTREGTVQDAGPIAVSTAPGDQRVPEVAGNGPFLVAWRETDEGQVHDVRGTRVGDDGVVLDDPSIAIAVSDDFEDGVALTHGPGMAWGTTYTRFVPEPPYGSGRVFLRNVAPK